MADKEKPAYEVQDNSNTEHASAKEQKQAAREGTLTEERVQVGGRSVSAEAMEPRRVKGVSGTLGLAPGAVVTVTLESGREVPASVIAVHPGRAADEEAGIQEEQPSLDVKAATGNPDTGGTELLFGVPADSVQATATFR